MPTHSPRNPPVLRFDGVSHRYDSGTLALSDIDLDVHRGEFISIIGSSGCGKSTLLRLAAGLETPSRGTVTRDESGRIAFVFQQPTLMPWARVRRNVALPLDLLNAPADQTEAGVDQVLRRVGLSEFAHAFPRELSGGMQMRASIARALITEPTLLFMDEPFGALDDITRARLDLELLSLWTERALTVVFVTHSLYEAVFLSTRVLVMSPRPGRIAAVLRIDEPGPRTEAFRVSDRFARTCAELSRMLTTVGSGG